MLLKSLVVRVGLGLRVENEDEVFNKLFYYRELFAYLKVYGCPVLISLRESNNSNHFQSHLLSDSNQFLLPFWQNPLSLF